MKHATFRYSVCRKVSNEIVSCSTV